MFRIKAGKQAVICLAALAFILLIACGFTYYNRVSKLGVLKAQIAEKQLKLANSEETAKRLTMVEQKYLDAQATLSVLEKGVSTKAYVPTLLRQVEELGKSVNLRIAGVRPRELAAQPAASEPGESGEKKVTKPEPYDRLDLDIEITGKYWDVVEFLRKTTNFPKIVTVNDLQMSPAGQVSEIASPVLNVRLNTSAFILREPVSQAKPNSVDQASAGRKRT